MVSYKNKATTVRVLLVCSIPVSHAVDNVRLCHQTETIQSVSRCLILFASQWHMDNSSTCLSSFCCAIVTIRAIDVYSSIVFQLDQNELSMQFMNIGWKFVAFHIKQHNTNRCIIEMKWQTRSDNYSNAEHQISTIALSALVKQSTFAIIVHCARIQEISFGVCAIHRIWINGEQVFYNEIILIIYKFWTINVFPCIFQHFRVRIAMVSVCAHGNVQTHFWSTI